MHQVRMDVAPARTLKLDDKLSSTIRTFSPAVHRRRRSGPGSTITFVMRAP
jgi:hypothetical protein